MSCWLARREVRRAFVASLSRRSTRRLFAHLRGCAACRAVYDRVFSGERLLVGGGLLDPSGRELALVAPLAIPRPPLRRAAEWVLLWAPAAAAAALVLGLLSVADEWRVRGRRPGLTVEAYCVLGDADFRAVDPDPGPGEVAACPEGSPVLLAYTSDAAALVYVRAGGVWLTPAASPLPVEATVQPLRLAVQLRAAPDLRVELYRVTQPVASLDALPPDPTVERLIPTRPSATIEERP